ncbi:ATP-binding protein [Caulobacter segnis]|uniref:sensor histidine kinase n=1 Tax=Caulobacter segnis TaxID=88688 RepID=UPI00240F8A41|nr:ATP-binding protein [Caulobacter segnis]MDG2520621.1 ATP-binding protein [Caulobacter segnis]
MQRGSMVMTVAERLRAGVSSQIAARARKAAALALAVAIFLYDTLATQTVAVAVLYVVVVVLFASRASRNALHVVGGLCAALTVASFVLVHGATVQDGSVVRMLVSLSAIALTTILVARNEAASQVIAASEARFRQIFESAGVMLWEEDYSDVRAMLDDLRARGVEDLCAYFERHPDFPARALGRVRIVDANAATMESLGFADKAAFLAAHSSVIAEASTAFTRVLQAMWGGLPEVRGRAILNGAGGRQLSVQFIITFPSDRPAPDRVLVSLSDMTAFEKAQDELVASQRTLTHLSRLTTLGELSASIAHELNQPLSAIMLNGEGSLRFLSLDPPDIGEARDGLRQMVCDADRASQVIKRIRDLSRKTNRSMEPVDLNVVVAQTGRLLEHDLQRHRVVLRLDLAENPPLVRGDRIELQQVLINLMVNAAQAMSDQAPERRVLTVATGLNDGRLRVSVRDHGAGVPIDALDQLFDAFYTTRSEGMGMGLAICRSIVESHGGQIMAGNLAQGGAEFAFALPVETVQ